MPIYGLHQVVSQTLLRLERGSPHLLAFEQDVAVLGAVPGGALPTGAVVVSAVRTISQVGELYSPPADSLHICLN